MYKHIVRFAFLLLAVIISGAISPTNAFTTLPDTIGGLKVLVTFPPGSQACAPADTTRILLQSTAPDVRTYLKSNRVQLILQDLDQLQRLSSMKYQVSVVATKATVETILQRNAKLNLELVRFGCPKKSSKLLSPPSTGSNGDELTNYAGPELGRTIFENMDAANYPSGSDIDNGQSVYLTSPSLIDPDNGTTYFLNNVLTNEDDFLQNGIAFTYDIGHIMWTNEAEGLYPVYLDTIIPYVANHEYWFVISHSWAWQLCQYDTSDINTYECIIDETSLGDNLQASVNTSIWLETYNTNSNWHDTFPALKMQDAEIFINGFPYKWSSEHRHTLHTCGTPPMYPTTNAMSGTLVSGGTAYFDPDYLPLYC